MPKKTKRQIHSVNAVASRWAKDKDVEPCDDDEGGVENYNEMTMDISDNDSLILESDDDEELNQHRSFFKENVDINAIGDIFQWCKEQCSRKDLSVLLCLALRYFGAPFEQTNTFLKDIGGLTAQVAHKWASVFVYGGFDEYCVDGRGGKRGDAFYDIYPEIESEAKTFVEIQCQQKSASFTTVDLAHFIDERYYEITGLAKTVPDLVRSIGSCRLDLRNWGARFEPNTQRPYFEGHERSDVVEDRNGFVNYFLDNKNNYYTVSLGEDPTWNPPSTNEKKILICKIITLKKANYESSNYSF